MAEAEHCLLPWKARNEGVSVARIGNYKIFGYDQAAESKPDLLVLDSNVCLHIEGIYFGTSRKNVADVQQLLAHFPYSKHFSPTHISSGWGNQELSWTRTGAFRAEASRRVQWATQRVLSWDPERVAFEFEHRRPPADRDKEWRRGAPLPEKDRHPLQTLLLSYGPLLRLCSLFKDIGRRGKRTERWAFDEYAQWMLDDFGYLLSYETALAIHALLGDRKSQSNARKIFHYGGNENADELADLAWAAAWDMQYARMIDLGALGLVDIAARRFKKIAVATEDSDPYSAKMRAQHIETIHDASIYVSEMKFEPAENDNIENIGYGISVLRRTQPRSLDCDPLKAIDTLERSLGVQRRTISAFRENPGNDASSSLLARLAEIDQRP